MRAWIGAALQHHDDELWLIAKQNCVETDAWLLRMGIADGMLFREDVFWQFSDEPELPPLRRDESRIRA